MYRNPTPNNQPVEWQPVTSATDVNFLDISNEGLNLAQNPHFKAVEFWDKLFVKYNKIAKNVENVKKSTKLLKNEAGGSREKIEL